MRRSVKALLPAAFVLACHAPLGQADELAAPAPPLPRDASRWVGKPASWSELRGRVTLVFVWTFGWVNCTRTAPWVRETATRYAERGLSALGIHAPEFDYERSREAVAAHALQLGLDFPQLVDSDHGYWRALGNQYWPTLYLVDRCGRIRGHQIGEVHAGEASGSRLEARIQALLAEDGGCGG